MSTLILAVNMREASEYAQLAGLQKHTWRAPSAPDDVRGARPELVVILPGYACKGNRFAINSEVRKRETPDTKRVIVTEDAMAALREAAATPPVESKWSGPYGEDAPLFEASSAWNPCPIHASQNQPCRECSLDAKAKAKPAKKAAAKKVTVPEADFF